jgi:hypothetical protein
MTRVSPLPGCRRVLVFDEEHSAFEEFLNNGPDGQPVIPIRFLRDCAIKLFDHFIERQSGINPDVSSAAFEEKCDFLSLNEAECIVRDFSASDDGEMFAVGGETKQEALAQIHRLMAAMLDRVMSNVVAAAVKEDLVDVAWDTDSNNFAFAVTEKGKKFVDDNEHRFRQDSPEEN